MNTPHVPSLVVAGAAIGLTLYNHNVWANVWNALRGTPIPLTQNIAPAASTVSAGNPLPPSAGGVISPSIPTNNDPLAYAEAAVTNTRQSNDWLNWCLQWYDDTMKRLGKRTFYGVGTAQEACNSQSLNKGPAPRGAAVCFNYNHIGISDGGCTFTSAGYPGGVQTRNYCNDAGYIGWFA